MRHFALYYKTVNIRIKYTKVVNFCFLPPPVHFLQIGFYHLV